VEEGRGRWTTRLVGLEEEDVKILKAGTELRDDKLYATIRALVDGVEEVCKIVFYRLKKGARIFELYIRGVEAKTRAEKLEVLTGEKPSVSKTPNGRTMIRGTGRHVEALAQYEELREAREVERSQSSGNPKTFKQTRYGSRRGCPSQVKGAVRPARGAGFRSLWRRPAWVQWREKPPDRSHPPHHFSHLVDCAVGVGGYF